MENKNETFKDRLELIMKEKDLNANSLAHEIGTNAVNIYRYLADENPSVPTNSTIDKIAKLGYSKKWLKFGEGERYDPSQIISTSSATDPLMEVVERIERSFSTLLEEKQQVIENQQFLIKNLMSQLGKLEPITNIQKAVGRVVEMRNYATTA